MNFQDFGQFKVNYFFSLYECMIPIILFFLSFCLCFATSTLVAPPLIVVMSANHPTFFVYFFAFGFSFGVSFPPFFHFGFDLQRGAQFNSSSIAHTFFCT
jgi:hypothetical protein